MDLIKEIYSDLKSGFRWLVKLSPMVKKQKYWMYGFIGLVLLVLFLISQSQKENGITDWISALANVVMAGAAITGVVFAKNWINDSTKQEKIRLASDILIDSIPQIQNHSFSSVCEEQIILNVKAIQSNTGDFDEAVKYIEIHNDMLRESFTGLVSKNERFQMRLSAFNFITENLKLSKELIGLYALSIDVQDKERLLYRYSWILLNRYFNRKNTSLNKDNLIALTLSLAERLKDSREKLNDECYRLIAEYKNIKNAFS